MTSKSKRTKLYLGSFPTIFVYPDDKETKDGNANELADSMVVVQKAYYEDVAKLVPAEAGQDGFIADIGLIETHWPGVVALVCALHRDLIKNGYWADVLHIRIGNGGAGIGELYVHPTADPDAYDDGHRNGEVVKAHVDYEARLKVEYPKAVELFQKWSEALSEAFMWMGEIHLYRI